MGRELRKEEALFFSYFFKKYSEYLSCALLLSSEIPRKVASSIEVHTTSEVDRSLSTSKVYRNAVCISRLDFVLQQ